MPVATDMALIADKVRQQLQDARRDGVFLKLVGEHLDDDWLYLTVELDQPGGRAADHARLMARIERQLRQEGYDQVLLVPALAD